MVPTPPEMMGHHRRAHPRINSPQRIPSPCRANTFGTSCSVYSRGGSLWLMSHSVRNSQNKRVSVPPRQISRKVYSNVFRLFHLCDLDFMQRTKWLARVLCWFCPSAETVSVDSSIEQEMTETAYSFDDILASTMLTFFPMDRCDNVDAAWNVFCRFFLC